MSTTTPLTQLKINSSFSIDTIQLKRFEFKQTGQLQDIQSQTLDMGIGAKAEKRVDSFLVVLDSDLSIKQSGTEVYNVSSAIMCLISVNAEFDPKFLNNVVAIMYSYLRPLVAQMTVMAKLPPLDLAPLDLSEVKVDIIDSLDNTSKTS